MGNLPFIITDKVKSDFKATLDFWNAARKVKNNILRKTDWIEYQRIEDMLNECSYCEYYGMAEIGCRYCPLEINRICTNAMCTYVEWKDSSNIMIKVEYANKIYKFILRWCNKNIFNQEDIK